MKRRNRDYSEQGIKLKKNEKRLAKARTKRFLLPTIAYCRKISTSISHRITRERPNEIVHIELPYMGNASNTDLK